MSLSWNEAQRKFVIYDNDKKKAEEIGLTKYSAVRGPNGETVWGTDSPYAAIPYFKDATPSAIAKLGPLYHDYLASWQVDSTRKVSIGAAALADGKSARGYQGAALDYCMPKERRLIGDAPGVGKTSTAIMLSNEEQAERNLVIVPANLRRQWEEQIRYWSIIPEEKHRRKTSLVMSQKSGINPSANFVIISYDLLRNAELHEAVCAHKWDHIIADEVHFAKSAKASRTRAIFGGGRGEFKNNILIDKAKRFTGLTGTLLLNRPRECFNITKACCPEAIDFMTYDEFCYRYNPQGTLENGHEMEARGRLPELQARLRCNYMVRRLKEDVLKDLPAKQYELTYLEPTGEIREVISRERMINFNIEDLKDPRAKIWGQISTLRREMGVAKAPRVIEHVKYLLEVEEIPKILLFSHHKEVMDRLKTELAEYGVVEVRGGVSDTQKNMAKKLFIENPRVRIFSGQLDSAGFGIDGLQEVCDRVVFAEPAWTPGVNDQAIDRLHRSGQFNSVLAQFLIVESSLDEKVLAAVIEKSKDIHTAMDGRGDELASMTGQYATLDI